MFTSCDEQFTHGKKSSKSSHVHFHFYYKILILWTWDFFSDNPFLNFFGNKFDISLTILLEMFSAIILKIALWISSVISLISVRHFFFWEIFQKCIFDYFFFQKMPLDVVFALYTNKAHSSKVNQFIVVKSSINPR